MKRSAPKFSIIICLYIITPRFYYDLEKYLNLKYKDFEIILVTEKDSKVAPLGFPVKIVKSNKPVISLGEKRDLGIKVSRGVYCAFIDDDAYPDPDWLTNALKIFKSSKQIGAVGGPNLTPNEDGFWAKIGGYIYESYFTSGEAQFRFLPGKKRYVQELQGVNLIIRKDILQKLDGFRSRLYSGDDSKVCSNIRELGYKLVYSPLVKVYHHRRPFPMAHLKQIRNMGKHRGFFVKAYPQTLGPMYFLPTILTVGFFVGLIVSLFYKEARTIFLSLLLLSFFLGFLSVVKRAGIFKSVFVALGIICTHMVYGIYFIKGFTLKTIERQNT